MEEPEIWARGEEEMNGKAKNTGIRKPDQLRELAGGELDAVAGGASTAAGQKKRKTRG